MVEEGGGGFQYFGGEWADDRGLVQKEKQRQVTRRQFSEKKVESWVECLDWKDKNADKVGSKTMQGSSTLHHDNRVDNNNLFITTSNIGTLFLSCKGVRSL